MESMRAYGAGLTGGGFDLNSFLKKPSVCCKLFALAFGAAIWFCIYKGGWHREMLNIHHQICLFNGSSSTCSFASAMGFFSLVAAVVLLFTDAQFDKISAIQTRKRVVMADMGVSGVFAVVFLLSFFSFFAKYSSLEMLEPFNGSWAKTSILLSLLAAVSWGGAAFLGYRRYQSGVQEPFASEDYQADFTGIPGDAADGYGYGGNSDGIGSVGNDSYQAGGGLPQGTVQQTALPSTNPFAGQSYQY